MEGGQRYFALVPTSLAVPNAPIGPMTSKQAKKAYQLRTIVPYISAAEHRRLNEELRQQDAKQEAEEKKDREGEIAKARAKAIREKKAIREQAERKERKRLGVPEPSKVVRASQPTITTFFNKGSKRTWEESNGKDLPPSATQVLLKDYTRI